MAKILRVIDPFFIMELGDVFEYNEDTKMYVSKHNEEFYKMDDGSINEVKSAYKSEFTISTQYAKQLIEEGYLEEASEEEKPAFVNIFDEIDTLLDKYTNGLATLEKDTVDLPACVKVERESVLTNLVTLLKHLKGLKK
jgi:vesicle coat complex subunit